MAEGRRRQVQMQAVHWVDVKSSSSLLLQVGSNKQIAPGLRLSERTRVAWGKSLGGALSMRAELSIPSHNTPDGI